jgi:hypothetical protein
MQEELKNILVTMIEMSMQSDCDMVNMGDWSRDDLDKALSKKTKIIEDLKDPKFDMANVPHEYFYQAIHDLALYFRAFGPDDEGLDSLQPIEHTLAKYIYVHFRD